MLTKLKIRNFKQFREVEIELGSPVVFVGPNNSGKTTALQALTLWDLGYRRWKEKRWKGGKATATERAGVAIARNELYTVPIPKANLMWRDLRTREGQNNNGKQGTKNVRIDITVYGVESGKEWECGFEFDYANEESFYCRPLRMEGEAPAERMEVPQVEVNVAYLPPMSGLSDREFYKQQGEIRLLIGQGRTAEVLRNLCYRLVEDERLATQSLWEEVQGKIKKMFGVEILRPEYIGERSEVVMNYKDRKGVLLDLSSAGRGLHQTLLLLVYLVNNQNTVLLLDEPDAHLEILRQRQVYQEISDFAKRQNSQLIIASHSEILMNEAGDRDTVVAFLGKPHRIDSASERGQISKALSELGFEQYYLAEQKGWIFYLEGATDLSILKAFAEVANHPAKEILNSPIFVHYVGTNIPKFVREHFFGLREAKSDFVGYALFDSIRREVKSSGGLSERMWVRREIENYFCTPEVLIRWAEAEGEKDGLFGLDWGSTMREVLTEMESASLTLYNKSLWSEDSKASDEVLPNIFRNFFNKVQTPFRMNKNDYYKLASLLKQEEIDFEIIEVLDDIVRVSESANPLELE